MIDERTAYLDLRLPSLTNPLKDDLPRLRETITMIDQYLQAVSLARGLPLGDATLDENGKVPLSQLSQSARVTEMSGFWDDMIGVVLDYALSTPPSPAWRLCYGQALLASDADAAKLRAKLIADGNPYGADGSGNPLLPDVRGRGTAGKDNMGGTAANRLTTAGSGINGATLGAAGGAETHTLTVAQMPTHKHGVTDPGHTHSVYDPSHAHSVADPGHAHGVYDPTHAHTYQVSDANDGGGGSQYNNTATLQRGATTTYSGTGIGIYAAATGVSIYGAYTGISNYASFTGITTNDNGGGQAHNNVQPTLVMNKIIKL